MEVNGHPVREWIDTYYESISADELAKDADITHIHAIFVLDKLLKDGFFSHTFISILSDLNGVKFYEVSDSKEGD